MCPVWKLTFLITSRAHRLPAKIELSRPECNETPSSGKRPLCVFWRFSIYWKKAEIHFQGHLSCWNVCRQHSGKIMRKETPPPPPLLQRMKTSRLKETLNESEQGFVCLCSYCASVCSCVLSVVIFPGL